MTAPKASSHTLGPRARRLWDVLQAALEEVSPPCTGDARFTADDIADAQVATLARICASCPILRECDAYGALQPCGVWAGVRRGQRVRADYKRRQRAEVSV